MAYYPYPDSRDTGSITTTEEKFTGQRLDSTGLYYYGARYYDPGIGRFIGADTFVQAGDRSPTPVLPLTVSYANPRTLDQWNELNRRGASPNTVTVGDPQFLNRYTYARDNPLAYTDDSGNFAWALAGAIVGGAVGFGAYYAFNRDDFNWRDAAVWAGVGAISGASLGMGLRAALTMLGSEAPLARDVVSKIVVAGPKLDYILRLDAGKAKGFEQLGYTMRNKDALQTTLMSIGRNFQLGPGVETEYGTKFEQLVQITGPNGAVGRVTIIWQIDKGSDVLRFITAIAEPFK